MAEGYVYILTNPSMPGLVKVGSTTRQPRVRAAELSRGTAVPTPYEVAYSEWVTDSKSAERRIHWRLNSTRLSTKREFFRVSVAEATEIVKAVAAEYKPAPLKPVMSQPRPESKPIEPASRFTTEILGLLKSTYLLLERLWTVFLYSFGIIGVSWAVVCSVNGEMCVELEESLNLNNSSRINAETPEQNDYKPPYGVKDIFVSRGVERDNRPLGITDNFTSDDTIIYVVFEMDYIEENVFLYVRFSKDGQWISDSPMISTTKPYDHSYFAFHLEAEDGMQFKKGIYRAQLFINGKPSYTARFFVR